MTILSIKNDIQIEYEFINHIKSENAIPIIFINGTIFNYKQWFPSFLPAFLNYSENEYNYLMYNYQGTGNSTSLKKTFTLQDMVDELNELMINLQIDKAHLFGMSVGNMIGQVFSSIYPDKVASLSGYGIVSLLGNLDDPVKMFKDRLNIVQGFGSLLEENIDKSNFSQIIRSVYAPAFFGKPYPKIGLKNKLISRILEKKIFNMFEGTPIKTMEFVFKYYVEGLESETIYYKEALQKLSEFEPKIPILFMNGSEDTTTTTKLIKKIIEILPHAEFIEFDGYQHISPALKKKQGKKIMESYVRFLKKFQQVN